MTKVTVVIPCYFRDASNIRDCLKSVFKQTYKSYNVLVLDEYSGDEIVNILEEYRRRYPRSFNYKQTHLNVPARYNKYIKLVKTEWVYFLDADCTMRSDCLFKLMREVEHNQEYITFAGNVRNPLNCTTNMQRLVGLELQTRYDKFPDELLKAPTMNTLVKTQTINDFSFDKALEVSYDADLFLRINKVTGKKIKYVKDAVIYHNHRASWSGFWSQQKKYAKFVPITYYKNLSGVKGDSI